MGRYAERRKQIYQSIKREGLFTWDFMYGDEYALATIETVDPAFVAEMRLATLQLGKVFARVANTLRTAPDTILDSLGLPRETWVTVRLALDMDVATTIGRFDFALTDQGLKMLEYNSDTPTSIVEAFYVNQMVADFFGRENPNWGCERQLQAAFQQIAAHYRQKEYAVDSIYFSALDWHIEDHGTAIYLMQQSGFRGAQFVPLRKLSVDQERLYASETEQRQPIDLLYRLHPLEYLAVEKDQAGYPIGSHLLKLIAEKKVAIINPPSAFLMQSKAVQALIWNLHEQKHFFSDEEHEIISSYLLPTYLDEVFSGVKPFVRKPFFGREGGGVSLFNQTGQLEATDQEQKYMSQPMVYQERVELPIIEVPTLKGSFQGRLLWGSFLVGGEASAIIARVDREITGDMAYYLPIGY